MTTDWNSLFGKITWFDHTDNLENIYTLEIEPIFLINGILLTLYFGEESL